MEDAHTTLLDLLSEFEEPVSNNSAKEGGGQIEGSESTASEPPGLKKRLSFFAVYDGHGGSSVAEYSGRYLHRYIALDKGFEAGNYREAIKNGFLKTDEELKRDPGYNIKPAGCTAVTALITDDWRVFCGNAGDSRAVLSRMGKAEPLSYDHKPMNADEARRIREAGGFVEFGRVNANTNMIGNLALSRAIGDFEFKQKHDFPPERQIVTCDPDIKEVQLSPGEDEFIIIACDGIWDCMTNQRAIDYIRNQISLGHSLSTISESIMDHCLAEDLDLQSVGADNMTVVIVALLDGSSVQEWEERIRERVRMGVIGGEEEEEQAVVVEEVGGGGFSLKGGGGGVREPILRH
ncbi:Protein phosphatase 2C 2 [Dinochytrium kinnereticum]|nr:Protein phosphatase 2C 2 [Dinochytrium kinnereticum]